MQFFLNKTTVSLFDTHWVNVNKFAKFVKMDGVQRVNESDNSVSGNNSSELKKVQVCKVTVNFVPNRCICLQRLEPPPPHISS
jgi:hypothetical protein